jgi:hypothetical protein
MEDGWKAIAFLPLSSLRLRVSAIMLYRTMKARAAPA